MTVYDQAGERHAREWCGQTLTRLRRPHPAAAPDGTPAPPRPLTEEVIDEASEPPDGEGWDGHLTADDHSREVLGCDPYSPEWEERRAAFLEGAERGAREWHHEMTIEFEAARHTASGPAGMCTWTWSLAPAGDAPPWYIPGAIAARGRARWRFTSPLGYRSADPMWAGLMTRVGVTMNGITSAPVVNSASWAEPLMLT